MVGIGPTTSFLPRKRSATELHRLLNEPERGVEPPTFALQKRCSAIELLRQKVRRETCLPIGRDSPTSKFPDGNFSQAAPRGARLAPLASGANSHYAAVFESFLPIFRKFRRTSYAKIFRKCAGRDSNPRSH